MAQPSSAAGAELAAAAGAAVAGTAGGAAPNSPSRRLKGAACCGWWFPCCCTGAVAAVPKLLPTGDAKAPNPPAAGADCAGGGASGISRPVLLPGGADVGWASRDRKLSPSAGAASFFLTVILQQGRRQAAFLSLPVWQPSWRDSSTVAPCCSRCKPHAPRLGPPTACSPASPAPSLDCLALLKAQVGCRAEQRRSFWHQPRGRRRRQRVGGGRDAGNLCCALLLPFVVRDSNIEVEGG